MDKLLIKGGTPLKGTVSINGAKNAAVAILPATILINGKCKIDNLPNISDVKLCLDILESIGAKINYISNHEFVVLVTLTIALLIFGILPNTILGVIQW